MLRVIVLVFVTMLNSNALAQENCKIDIWTRANGQYAYKETYKQKITSVNIGSLPSQTMSEYDIQYSKNITIEAIQFKNIVKNFKRTGEAKYILLHFSNGMIVPKNKKKILVAKAIKIGKNFTNQFPEIPNYNHMFRDPRPLKFGCNKVLSQAPKANLNPWLYTDTLVGIEYVDKKSYENQFVPVKANAAASRGAQVFLNHCQYCHGIKNIGATFGWDYSEPSPLYKKRNKESLFIHTTMEPSNKIERGLKMPAQPDISKKEISDLWEWMKAASTSKLPAYKI